MFCANKDEIYESFVNLDTDSLRRFLALEVGYGGSLHFRVSNFAKQGAGHFQWGFDGAALADENSLPGLRGFFSVIWSDLRSVSSSWIVRVWRKENGDVDGEDDGSGVSVSRRIRIRFCTVRTFFRRGGTDFYQFQEQGTFTVSFQPRVSKFICPWSCDFVFWSLCLLPYVFLRISMLSIQFSSLSLGVNGRSVA